MPGANDPKPPRLAWGAVLKLFSCGMVAIRSGVFAAPMASISSRVTAIRFEPVGGTPRMLEPVTISSSSVVDPSSWGAGA